MAVFFFAMLPSVKFAEEKVLFFIRAFDWYRLRWPWMTLNAAIALILRFFHRIRQIFRPIISQWSGWR